MPIDVAQATGVQEASRSASRAQERGLHVFIIIF